MPWVLAQTACDVVAVHVPVDRDALAARLPPGLVPDEHDGSAWVTLLAMRMVAVRPRFVPPVPGVSSFAQVAARAFVHREVTGEPGIAFLSIEVSKRFVAVVGRVLLGLPFRHGAITVGPGTVTSERLHGRWEAADAAEVDAFFAERDVLFSARRGRLCRSVVRHPPVRFTGATLDGDVAAALAAEALAPVGPARVVATARLPSHVWLPRAVRPAP